MPSVVEAEKLAISKEGGRPVVCHTDSGCTVGTSVHRLCAIVVQSRGKADSGGGRYSAHYISITRLCQCF